MSVRISSIHVRMSQGDYVHDQLSDARAWPGEDVDRRHGKETGRAQIETQCAAATARRNDWEGLSLARCTLHAGWAETVEESRLDDEEEEGSEEEAGEPQLHESWCTLPSTHQHASMIMIAECGQTRTDDR